MKNNILKLNSLSKINEELLMSFKLKLIFYNDPNKNQFMKDLIENKDINLIFENENWTEIFSVDLQIRMKIS